MLKIRNSEEVVKVKIKQKFEGFGVYAYEKHPTAKEIYSTDQEPPLPFPHEFTIGKGNDLKKNYRGNIWEITLINLEQKKLNYNLSFEWYQGNDKKPLYTWPEKNNEKEGTLENGKHVTFRGKCFYV